MSISIDQLKRRIIELVNHTDDREQLNRVYGSLSGREQRSAEELRKELFASGGVTIGPAPSLDKLFEKQEVSILPYDVITSLVNEAESESDPSLEELLNALD